VPIASIAIGNLTSSRSIPKLSCVVVLTAVYLEPSVAGWFDECQSIAFLGSHVEAKRFGHFANVGARPEAIMGKHPIS
jgi:hypothetical protein